MKISKYFSRLINRRSGFTLVELLVYTGIFTVSSGLMVGVLNTVSRVQNREAANIEVTQQSQFVINTIKTTLSEASLIDIDPSTTVSSLKLRMPDPAKDPTYIYLENGIVFKKETDDGTPVALH